MTGRFSASSSRTKLHAALPFLIAIVAWIVPGLGHALLRRWARAPRFFLAATGPAIAGCELRGETWLMYPFSR